MRRRAPSPALQTEPDRSEPAPNAPTPPPEPTPEATVLVVDDDASMRHLVRRALRGLPIRAVEAPDGATALELFESERPDLVLCDIMMPGMSGLEVLEHLKEREGHDHVPVIMMTALTDTSDVIEGLDRGAEDYVRKPFEVAELRARVRSQLRVRRLARELARRNAEHEEELRMARTVQAQFLPQSPPEGDGWRVHAVYEPMVEVGGDFYDLLPVGDDGVAIFLSDVVGHGVGAALITAMVKTALATFGESDLCTVGPDDVLRRVDRITSPLLESGKFVTAFYGTYDPGRRRLRYSSAGHLPPMRLHAADGAVTELKTTEGLPLGVLGGEGDMDVVEATLEPGDHVVFYTDGVTEMTDTDGRLFTEARLKAALRSAWRDGEDDMLDAVLRRVHAFAEGAPRKDDLNVVVLSVE